MQAARILGIEKLGLANLLGDLYGIDHPKGLQKADWSKRPLTPEMCKYARMDTHHLMRLRGTLGVLLKERNLLDLAEEDFARICHSEANHKNKILYTQVSGYQKLDPRSLCVLNELAEYRDGLAQKLNRPHFKVMGSNLLLAVAQAQPGSRQELFQIGKVSTKILERYQDGLLAAVKRGMAKAPMHLEKHKRPAQDYIDRFEALQEWRKRTASNLKVQSDIVMPRDVLEEIASSRPRNLKELEPLMRTIPRRFEQFGSEIVMVIAKGKTL
jgi:ribonuclease D